MLKQQSVSIAEIIDLENRSCIPLASMDDKLLTVSPQTFYTVSINGTVVYSGNNAHAAIEKYNGIPNTEPVIEKRFVRPGKRLHQLIPH